MHNVVDLLAEARSKGDYAAPVAGKATSDEQLSSRRAGDEVILAGPNASLL